MKDKIYECEVKRQYLIDGQRVWKWKRSPVSEVAEGEEIRCYQCQGKVRLHKKRVEHGPRDHVEHLSRDDSKKCPLGYYFKPLQRGECINRLNNALTFK